MKSVSKVLVPVLVVAFLLLIIPASTIAQEPEEESVVADFVMVGCMVHPYLNNWHEGGTAAGEDLGREVYYISPVQFDPTRQLEMLEDVMHWPGVKGIGVLPADPHAFDTVYQEIQDKGIELVTSSSMCNDTSPYPICFATDFHEAGWQTGKHMAELMGHEGQAAIVLGNVGDENVNLRGQGFEDYMAENEPDIEVVVKAKGGDTPEGTLQAAESIISGYPDVDAIAGMCQFCGVGPAAVVAANERDDIIVSGFDDSPEMIEAIAQGNAAFTVMQQPWGQGYLTIWVLDQMVKGKEPAMRYVDTGIYFVDESNVDSYMDAVNAYFKDHLLPYFESDVMLEPDAADAVRAAATEEAEQAATE